MKYELSDQVKNNIVAFLIRTDIKGGEAASMVEIGNALNTPIADPVEPPKE